MKATMLLLLLGLAFGQDEVSAPARVVVLLPPDARLFIDDSESTQTEDVRVLRTPPLEPGYTYSYALRAETRDNDNVLSVRRKVSFRAGSTVTVDFRNVLARPAFPERRPKKAVGSTRTVSGEEQALLELTNKEREEAGLPALQLEARLAKAARDHSANMARQQKMDHALDDKGPAERVRDAGYTGFGFGENIAYGQRNPAEVVEVWMSSPGHRANILGKHYTHIGIGIARDERGLIYYTQVFGSSR